jgi:hypothetical protein
MIKHKEFGDYLVQVFVIKLQREEEQQAGESWLITSSPIRLMEVLASRYIEAH